MYIYISLSLRAYIHYPEKFVALHWKQVWNKIEVILLIGKWRCRDFVFIDGWPNLEIVYEHKFRIFYTKLKVEKNQKLGLTIGFVGREKSKEKMLMR